MFYYSVTATLNTQIAKDQYLTWLKSGHVQALLQWAIRAEIIDLHSDSNQFQVKSMYLFKDQDAFQHYLQEGAPKLRAEGAVIAQELGIQFLRQSGEAFQIV